MHNNNSQDMEEQQLNAAAETESAAAAEEQAASAQTSQDEEETAESAAADTSVEADLQAQLDAYKDKYLRQAAEFDNYRKRVIREKADLAKAGGESVIKAILPVLDDFERGEQNMDKMDDVAAVKEGVRLIIDKFLTILKKEGMEKIEAVGQPFNVDFHEAIAMVPAADDDQKGKVIDCVQTGYKLNDKVIRHAKVAVAQ